jgi:hypothetical protein
MGSGPPFIPQPKEGLAVGLTEGTSVGNELGTTVGLIDGIKVG